MRTLITSPTRYLFFTGKGGVGKTTLATSTAVALADQGHRVLLVSTDPASNLGQVLETEVTHEVRSVSGVPLLDVVNIDPEAAAQAYRDRVIEPVRQLLPPAAIEQITESLSGACTTEIASFDAFTRLLTDASLMEDFDHVVFDTAPTGHTLRLLQLPAAWGDFIDTNPDGASCLGPASGLQSQRVQYAAAVDSLRDPATTTLVLVTRPEPAALNEAARTAHELADLGILSQRLVVNGVFSLTESTDPLAAGMQRRQVAAMDNLPSELRSLPIDTVPLQPHNLVGLAHLRALASGVSGGPAATAQPPAPPQLPSLADLVQDIEAAGKGLVVVMGKGGVGKTTIAAAVAVELARHGHTVHLSTTDPAAHLVQTVKGSLPGLTVSRIDPAEEVRRYTDRVFATKGKDLDDDAKKLLEEDLRSPCTEEVAVFHAFSNLVREAARGFVVLDTAPTGHTLLLLDQTGAYHREVERNSRGLAGRATTPLMRLQDPAYTKLLIVTLPETTPVLEAAGLQADLRRASITPYAWVINQSLAAASPTDKLLVARAAAEIRQIQLVAKTHATRTFLVPWMAKELSGVDALTEYVGDLSVALGPQAQAFGKRGERAILPSPVFLDRG